MDCYKSLEECIAENTADVDAVKLSSTAIDTAHILSEEHFLFADKKDGSIEAILSLSRNTDILVIIDDKDHWVACYNSNVSFERKFPNGKIWFTVNALVEFKEWYRYFYQ